MLFKIKYKEIEYCVMKAKVGRRRFRLVAANLYTTDVFFEKQISHSNTKYSMTSIHAANAY